jgi:hypothetical protein
VYPSSLIITTFGRDRWWGPAGDDPLPKAPLRGALRKPSRRMGVAS